MEKPTSADRSFFAALVTSGLLAVTFTAMSLSTGPGDSVARAAARVTPSSSMAAQQHVAPRNTVHDSYGQRQLLVSVQSAARPESALLPTLPTTSLPTLRSIETLIPETPELPLPTLEAPSLPTVPPVLSTPVTEPSTPPTPTATPTESNVEQNRRRLALLGGLGLAILCGGGIVVAGVLLLFLRRERRRTEPRGVAPPPVPEGHPMLIVPGIDRIVLDPGVTTIGRSEENDIIIEGHQVSRYHARIECIGSVCMVEDLQSSNGSFLNGNRVSRAVLTSGDRLRVGSVEMTYRAPEAQAPGAWLEVNGESYPMSASGLTIGRSSENEIRLVDPLASRRHARVEPRQDAHVLTDLDSANGTFVNGQRVQQHTLRDGDEIQVGSSRITFHGQAAR